MEHIKRQVQSVLKGGYDVIVVGGGFAGISAALSARRNGSKVLLIEKEYSLGGLATLGLVTIYLPIDDGFGKQVVYGIGEELLLLSVSHGSEMPLPEAWKGHFDKRDIPKSEKAVKRTECRFNASLFSILAEKLLISEGVDILYGTYVVDTKVKNSKITHLIVENKSGCLAYFCNAVVDASGDADVFKFSGAEYKDNEKGNILAAWYYYGDKQTVNNLKQLGFCDSVLNRNAESEIDINTRYSGLDGDNITLQTIAAHSSILNNFLKTGDLSVEHTLNSIAAIPQNRMTRKIVAPTILDIFQEKHYKDSVGTFPNWRKRGPIYELPFSSLYSVNIKNLISAGRIICVTDESWDITRVIPVCAVSGEAAGLAASLLKTSFKNLSIKTIQSILKKRGVKLSAK